MRKRFLTRFPPTNYDESGPFSPIPTHTYMATDPLFPTRFLGARLAPALTLTESGFLFCARDGETYSLNPTGACLLRGLLDGVAPIDIWQELVKRFDVPALRAQRDAQLFLSHLFGLGVLELPKSDDGGAP